MLSAREFRELVSGERKDVLASILRMALSVAEIPYAVAVRLRNRRYDRGRADIQRVDVPVICVGNLTLGGTGKTPMVHYLANWFHEQNVRVAIVSRGYGSRECEQNDEAKELSEKLPSVPHIQNPDRVAAARTAVAELKSQVILLDDGFQHRRLARDLDVVLIDALEPFGFDRLFPRGTLREPIEGLQRANVVALSRADLVSDEKRNELRQRVQQIAPQTRWVEVAHVPHSLLSLSTSDDLACLKGKRILAFCGIGNPAGFRHTLASCGAEIICFREYPDHHAYARSDIDELSDLAERHSPELMICTHKDLVKINADQIAEVPLKALLVELRVLQGEDELHQSLEELLAAVGG